MYSNIVIGVDGNQGGRDAAALAAILGERDARMTVAHVWITNPLPGRHSDPAFELGDDLVQRERDQCRFPADAIHVGVMSVGAGLEQLAAEREADLIVVGSSHRGLVGRVLVGDDAASVLHHAQRSVAIAPSGFQSHESPPRTVGVAYDGSEESEIARSSAESLAEDLGAELICRCAVSPHVFATGVGAGAAYIEDPNDLVSRTRAELGELGKGRLDVVVGMPNTELAAFSDGVDVLVCGSRHNGPMRRVVLGSTSDYLAHHSRCPLIVTPRPAEAHGAQADQSSVAVV